MEFVTVRELRIETASIWEKLEKERDLIITLNGRPVALMTGISGQTLENVLKAVRKARAQWAIKAMQQSAIQRNLHKLPTQKIDAIIRKTRQLRKRESHS